MATVTDYNYLLAYVDVDDPEDAQDLKQAVLTGKTVGAWKVTTGTDGKIFVKADADADSVMLTDASKKALVGALEKMFLSDDGTPLEGQAEYRRSMGKDD